MSPARVVHTRDGTGRPGTAPTQTTTFDVPIAGVAGVPSSGAVAVVLNVTVTQPTASSFLSLWPAGATQPNVSHVNFVADQTVANPVTVTLGSGGSVSIRNNAGFVHVIADVMGWYSGTGGPGAGYVPLSPARILDSRDGTGGSQSPVTTTARRVTGGRCPRRAADGGERRCDEHHRDQRDYSQLRNRLAQR